MIREMAPGKVIMLSTHVLEEVEAICSRVIIISSGKIVADSDPATLKRRSKTYNALTLQIVASADEAEQAFDKVPDVTQVRVLEKGEKKARLQLLSRDQQPLAATALEVARSHHWLITDMQTDGGRLDEVFKRITTTEDVA